MVGQGLSSRGEGGEGLAWNSLCAGQGQTKSLVRLAGRQGRVKTQGHVKVCAALCSLWLLAW